MQEIQRVTDLVGGPFGRAGPVLAALVDPDRQMASALTTVVPREHLRTLVSQFRHQAIVGAVRRCFGDLYPEDIEAHRLHECLSRADRVGVHLSRELS